MKVKITLELDTDGNKEVFYMSADDVLPRKKMLENTVRAFKVFIKEVNEVKDKNDLTKQI
jgi:hypothetical protein